VTVDGYSYLKRSSPTKPVSAPAFRAAPLPRGATASRRCHLFLGSCVVIGFSVMKLLLNVQRLTPGKTESTAQTSPSASPATGSKTGSTRTCLKRANYVASAPSIAPTASPARTIASTAVAAATSGGRSAPSETCDSGRPHENTRNTEFILVESGEQNSVAIRT